MPLAFHQVQAVAGIGSHGPVVEVIGKAQVPHGGDVAYTDIFALDHIRAALVPLLQDQAQHIGGVQHIRELVALSDPSCRKPASMEGPSKISSGE